MHIVDCDIHQPLEHEHLLPYLPAYFRQGFFQQKRGNWNNPLGEKRAVLTSDGSEGDSLSPQARLMKDHMEPWGITHGILTGGDVLGAGVNSNSRYAVEYFRAYNDALIEQWLGHDERLYGAMIVAPQDPLAAAKEIRRVGAHPKIVQVMLAGGLRTPLGQTYYWPIYEACVEMELPFALHSGTEARGIANGFVAGHPSSYIEWHVNLPQNFMGHAVSLVLEGVFEQFPQLRFIALESGLAWIPGLIWRMDKNWKALRSTVPWLKRPPSEYAIDHIRFTTQPMEEPFSDGHFGPLMEMIRADKTLLYASNHPFGESAAPSDLLSRLDPKLHERVLWRNAAELYGFADLLETAPMCAAQELSASV